jgi:hypothetical protein
VEANAHSSDVPGIIRRLTARHRIAASANPIHDDTKAREVGFSRAPIPGVDVYWYMCHAAIDAWGEDWASTGGAAVKFVSPVYDAEVCDLVLAGRSAGELDVELVGAGRTKSRATFIRQAPEAAWNPPREAPVPQVKQTADEVSLAPGNVLGTSSRIFTALESNSYLDWLGEGGSFFRERGCVHPGFLLKMCNYALDDSVALGAWLYTASKIQHRARSHVDELLQARAVVAANYERGGHRWFELDVHVLGESGRAIANVRHQGIYRLRPKSGIETHG